MTNERLKDLAQRIYKSVNCTMFNGILPEVDVIIEHDNKEWLGMADTDLSSILTRLDEIEQQGEPKTPLKKVMRLTTGHNNESTANTIIALTSTILHEAIHFAGADDHGAEFQQMAVDHGLTIIRDSAGNYLNTEITVEAAEKILLGAGLAKRRPTLCR